MRIFLLPCECDRIGPQCQDKKCLRYWAPMLTVHPQEICIRTLSVANCKNQINQGMAAMP